MTFRSGASGFAAILLIASAALAPASAADGRKKALATGAAAGLAAGVLGGVLLDRTVLNPGQPAAAPRIDDADVTYSNPRPARAVQDPYIPRLSGLKAQCDDGDTRACIRFGIIIGQHKEREAQWRRQQPDMFEYERN